MPGRPRAYPLVHHAVNHGHRRFGEDAERRIDERELLGAEFLAHQPGFILPRQQHIAQATLCEARCRTARAGVEHWYLAEQPAHEVLGESLGGPRLALRPGECGQEIPPRTARGLWIRRDHANAGLQQVGPVVNPLWIALAHKEDDRARIG